MYGDFARVTFDALKNRSRVLMQQGRVQLEADWNEQGAIFLHLLRTLAKDLFGPAWGPEGNCGFAVLPPTWVGVQKEKQKLSEMLRDRQSDFLIGKGHYYVDGILCENPEIVSYAGQPPRFGSGPDLKLENGLYLAYLDVAEYSVFAAQDDSMLEVAIGIETAIRARQSWVVRTVKVTSHDEKAQDPNDIKKMNPSWDSLVEGWQSARRGRLQVRAGRGSDDMSSGPCIVAPQSRYRGAENQLYRVEVHRGGEIEIATGTKKPTAEPKGGPTFKFSRVNGSAVYRIESFADPIVTLADLGRDDRFDLDEGNWVEILDDTTILPEEPGRLRKVVSIDTFTRQVTLETSADAGKAGAEAKVGANPFMRRWDQRQGDPGERGLRLQDGVAPIELRGWESLEDGWIPLEDGVEIRFQPPPEHTTGKVVFRAGDYWLAPARVATGGIIDWPQNDGVPFALPPHGVEHHYAPLAILSFDGKDLLVRGQFRRVFEVAGAAAITPFGAK